MQNYLTEAKPQTWRAVAIFEDDRECLLYLGMSSPQIRAGYVNAFFEVLDEEEREQVRSIQLQCWNGAPDAGRWQTKTTLNIPSGARLAKSAA